MFEASTYQNRRLKLAQKVSSGVLLFLTNEESPMNYADNPFRYRQDSSFLYFFGIEKPGLIGIVDIDENKTILYGNDYTMDDIIWMGPQKKLVELAEQVGIQDTAPPAELASTLNAAIRQGRKIHFLPPYRPEHTIRLHNLLGIKEERLTDYISEELIRAIIELRSVKEDIEVVEIENAHAITAKMHRMAMQYARPGRIEREISGLVQGIAQAHGNGLSFPVIMSVHGEVLHNHFHENRMQEGDLLINDSGAEALSGYAADITRTIPVAGKFLDKQKDIYQIVLDAQLKAIEEIKPEVPFRDIHLKAARVIADGLKSLGLLKGDVDSIVEQGAHALFFPHGLGHMMGLDVHDMENLGENLVGYDDEIKRSEQFGLSALRLGKRLKRGFVLTVEPGIYFIPALIEKWQAEGKFKDFINYSKIEKYLSFGGIRIEDDVLVTEDGVQLIGEEIPRTVEEVEQLCSVK